MGGKFPVWPLPQQHQAGAFSTAETCQLTQPSRGSLGSADCAAAGNAATINSK
jgi:hypothetical protein